MHLDPDRIRLGKASPAQLAQLQRTVGNAAVQRLFGSKKKKKRKQAQQGPDLRSDARKAFDAKTFTRKDWRPSTGTGKFDAAYSPKDGVLHIKMRVHFNFQDVGPEYKNDAVDKKETKWTAAQKKDWSAKWIDSVLGKWGNIAPFKCDKPGFQDVSVKPQIDIEVVKDPGKAHYALDVSKAFQQKEGGMRAGGLSGVDREGGGMFQEQDVYEKINKSKVSKHLRAAEGTGNIMPAFERDRERLVSTLGRTPSIMFLPNSDEFDVGGLAAAQALATALLGLRASSALADLHPVHIFVGLDTGENKALLLTRFHKIKAVLEAAGVKNALSAKLRDAPGAWAVAEAGPSSDAVKQDYMARWDRYTSAHEFGHMIGLLDEYCPAVSPELILKMVNEGAIDAKDSGLSNYAKGRVDDNKDPQTAYAKLLDKTGLSVPNWARPGANMNEKSTSLMSGGFEVLRQHHITFWEVLADMTKDDIPEQHWKV